MDGTTATAFLVGGASMKLLVRFYAFCRTEVKLRSTIGAIQQSRKQTLSARGGISSATITEFLNTIEGVLVYDSFLGIRDNLPFFFRVMNCFVYLVADGVGFLVK